MKQFDNLLLAINNFKFVLSGFDDWNLLIKELEIMKNRVNKTNVGQKTQYTNIQIFFTFISMFSIIMLW